MKIIKKIIISLMFILLVACSFDITKEDVDNVKNVFSEQIDKLYEFYEKDGKQILSNLSVENAEKMLDDILAKIPEDKKQLAYNGIKNGVSIIEDGKEILANELSMDVSFEGVKEEIDGFLESLSNLEAGISVEDVLIEKTGDNYKLDCTINFYYSSDKR